MSLSPCPVLSALGLFEGIQGFWPVLTQQPREGAVGEQAPAGLALGAVVRFVAGVDNALHGSAAARTRLAELAVDGHVGAEGGDLLGESVPRLLLQPRRPR